MILRHTALNTIEMDGMKKTAISPCEAWIVNVPIAGQSRGWQVTRTCFFPGSA